MEKIKQELKDFGAVVSLLGSGHGSLSDYLLISVPFVVGLLIGSGV